jgi:hypothetical protein
MKTSEMINEIAKAMSIAQGEMKPASKSSENPFFRSKYSNLAQVWDSIRDPLSKNGLCIFQDVLSIATGISISTRVCHASGQWIEFGPLEIPVAKKDAQSVGSATSYGKRYDLCAALGVVSDEEGDDDGEAAMGRQDSMPKNNGNKPKQEPVKEPVTHQATCITQEQVRMISDAIEQCDESYVNKLSKHLLDKGFPSYAHIPQDMFNQIMTGIGKNIELVEKRRKENGN